MGTDALDAVNNALAELTKLKQDQDYALLMTVVYLADWVRFAGETTPWDDKFLQRAKKFLAKARDRIDDGR